MIRPFLLLAPLIALAACSETMMIGESNVEPSLVQRVGHTEAMAALPDRAGRVINVAERRYSNGIVQEITLEGDATTQGENGLTIAMRGGNAIAGAGTNPLKIERPSERAIQAELYEKFPRNRMTIAATSERNGYGPFGYATGRGPDGGRCLYGWQMLDNAPDPTGRATTFLSPNKPMSIRARICRDGVSDEELVGLMKKLVIFGRPESGYL